VVEIMKKILSLMLVASLVLSGLIVGQLFFSSPVSAPGPDLPDLALWPENITISPALARVGDTITINVTIWNIGSQDVTNVTANFYEGNTFLGSSGVFHIPVSGYWVSEKIDTIGNVGSYSSIAIDSDNGIHISYGDNTNGDLKYAYKENGGSWNTYTADSSGTGGRYSSIAVDSVKDLHISYLDDLNNDLKYAYKPSGGVWSTHTVDSIGIVGKYCSLAVDDANGVHISYYDDFPNYNLKYAYKPSGGNWTNITVDSSDAVGSYSSIAVDDANGVHISYYDANMTDLKYAYKPSGGSWNSLIVDASPGVVGSDTSIAVDSANGIHISYYDVINADLKYAYKPNGGSWTNYSIDYSGIKGTWTSIAIDGLDGVHISYYDGEDKDLKYAFKSNGGNWTTRKVDSQGDVGYGTSIAVDSSNGIHISYRDEGIGDLKYANQIIPPGNVYVGLSWTPTKPGIKNITVRIDEENEIEESDETNNEASLEVTVEPGPLVRIEVEPFLAYLELNETLQYSAKGYDAYDNELYISPEWNVSGGGIIYQRGFFIAKYPGNWTVYANDSGISGYAIVYALLNDSLDNDFDGIPNGWEVNFGLNPFDASDAAVDLDNDGLSNLQEYQKGSKPNNNDTDGDNLGDGFEVIFSKTRPDIWDTNGNGLGDGLEFIQSKGYLGWIESLPDDWIGMTITWDNYTILVKTNSSVLEGEFDKEEQKLKIKVSGPDGTQGVTEIQMPKGLCDPMDLEISMDGELINFTFTEDETYYYIHVEYNHSIHELSTHFQESEVIEDPMDDEEDSLAVIYLLFLIMAVIAVLLLLKVIVRNKKSWDIGVQELPPDKLINLLEKKYSDGQMTDKTYEDIKSLLDKYNGK
jgi:hypothetical protein